MAYIELKSDLIGWHPKTLFAMPFTEGVRNLTELSKQPNPESIVGHLIVGILLLIPIVNTVVFLILRELSLANPIMHEQDNLIEERVPPEELNQLNDARTQFYFQWTVLKDQFETFDDVTPNAIENMQIQDLPESLNPITEYKNQLIQEWNSWQNPDTREQTQFEIRLYPEGLKHEAFALRRNELIQQNGNLNEIAKRTYELIKFLTSYEIELIEIAATEHMEITDHDLVTIHLNSSAQNQEYLLEVDGVISGARYSCILVRPPNLPEATFKQIGGLHQYNGGNHLCGYYALYSLFQAVSGQNGFANRQMAHPHLVRWTKMVQKMRVANWLSQRRDQLIPAKMKMSSRGISPAEVSQIIQNDDNLQQVRATQNCFVIELDAWDQRNLGEYSSNSITPLGNMENRFPLYCMIKIGMHYYGMWATNPWEFTIVHSMGSSIHNKAYFPEQRFFDIVECLKSYQIEN